MFQFLLIRQDIILLHVDSYLILKHKSLIFHALLAHSSGKHHHNFFFTKACKGFIKFTLKEESFFKTYFIGRIVNKHFVETAVTVMAPDNS